MKNLPEPSPTDVAANAAASSKRRGLLDERERINASLAEIDKALGLDKLMMVEPGSAYELREYTCLACRFDWLASDIAPCPLCRPVRLYTSRPINARSLLPALVLSPEERAWIVDQLPLRALNLRGEGWSAAARLARPDKEVDAIRRDLLDRADQTDALARELEEGREGSVWLPLAEASVFSERPYLLSPLSGYNRLVGRVSVCRLDPAVGWMEQSLGGHGALDIVRRADPGFAVFIPSGHP